MAGRFSDGVRRQQMQYAVVGGVKANPGGETFWVDSNVGSDGNNGESFLKPLATLARALALASAGDTIILMPGGSETVTETVAVDTARVRIVCPAENPASAYTIGGAGTLDLMTVSAQRVEVVGLKFIHTGVTSSAAGILLTADADKAYIKGCFFDDSQITTNFTGFGIEITDACNDIKIIGCEFRDCHRAIKYAPGDGTAQVGSEISDCKFWVGQATAFGIYAEAAVASGTIAAMFVRDCEFIETDGDGSAATDAWDGSNGEDAASGPVFFAAECDRVVMSTCRAYTALARSFDIIAHVESGGEVDFNKCSTGEGGALEDEVASVGTQVGSLGTLTTSVGVAVASSETILTTAISSSETIVTTATASVGTLTTSVGVAVASSETILTTAISSSETIVTTATASVGTLTTSVGVAVASSETIVTTAVASVGALTTSVGLAVASAETIITTAISSSETIVTTAVASVGVLTTSVGLAVASSETITTTAISSSETIITTATTSIGTAVASSEAIITTAISSTEMIITTATTSIGTAVASSEAIITTGSTSVGTLTTSVGVLVATKGRPVTLTQILADDDIPSNAQSKALVTASGDVLIKEIVMSKDGVNLTGMTNIEITCNNVYGPTGLTSDLFANIVAGLNANLTLLASGGGVTPFTEMVLESGKILYIHGDDGPGTSSANIKVSVRGIALTDGASLS